MIEVSLQYQEYNIEEYNSKVIFSFESGMLKGGKSLPKCAAARPIAGECYCFLHGDRMSAKATSERRAWLVRY